MSPSDREVAGAAWFTSVREAVGGEELAAGPGATGKRLHVGKASSPPTWGEIMEWANPREGCWGREKGVKAKIRGKREEGC